MDRLTLVAIDDDPERYRHLAERLDLHAVDVWCSDVPSAVLARVTKPDVVGVFLDHVRPGCSGRGSCRTCPPGCRCACRRRTAWARG
jgi:hypothetical protein